MNGITGFHSVAITGATGFIGGRLAEVLSRDLGTRVTALYRDAARAIRLARLPVHLRQGDVLSVPSLKQAFAGCQIVFHCAYHPGGSRADQFRTNVEGTVNVIRAARQAGVRRVVYTSTIGVYGHPPSGMVTEEWPRSDPGGAYEASKIAAETRATSLSAELGLELVVVQPSIVFGPEGPAWTISPIRDILEHRLVLIDEGQGKANCVYIDDLVSALLLTAQHPAAAGRAYIVNHPEVPTYADFLGAYARMIGFRSLPSMSSAEARRRRPRKPSRLATAGLALRAVRADVPSRNALLSYPEIRAAAWARRALLAALGRNGTVHRAAVSAGTTGGPPDARSPSGLTYAAPPVVWPLWARLSASRATYVSDCLRRELGWAPQVNWRKGMRLTAAWLASSGLVPRVHDWEAPARTAVGGVAG